MTQLYVYNDKEVYLTGRTATRVGKRKDKILHEIKLTKYGDSAETFAWVELSSMYTINTKDSDNKGDTYGIIK